MGTGAGKTSKFSAIFLASVLLFSTVSISSLVGMTPLPNAYAGGDESQVNGLTCNLDPISSDDEGKDKAMTYWKSEGVFLWANNGFDLFRLTVDGDKTIIDFLDHETSGLAFSLDGKTLYSVESQDDQLFIVDPTDASTISSKDITLAGEDVEGARGLAIHPTTGVLWVLLRIDDGGSRGIIVTLDPFHISGDAVATLVGNTGTKMGGLAFDSSGTLFAISTTGANIPSSLFTINTSNGISTLVCSIGGGRGGTSIAFNPDDGALYLSLAESQFFKFLGGIQNLNRCETQNIPTDANRTITAMTFRESVGDFLFANFGSLFSLGLDGDSKRIGNLIGSHNHNSKGLAFIGDTLYSLDRNHSPFSLHTVDPNDGSVDSSKTITITLAGFTPRGGIGLATHPTTDELWAIIRDDRTDRILVTIDPTDGKATLIGAVGHISGLAFDSSGTLFGVTGDGAIPVSNSLVTLSQTDGTLTFVCQFVANGQGEAISFNSDDGSLYHMSGSTIFEKVVGFDAPPFVINAQRLALFSIARESPLLHEIELPSGNIINTVFIKTEFPLLGGTALTTDSSNQMYAVLNPGGGGGGQSGEAGEDRDFSRLAIINPITGGTSVIGILSDTINGLAFKDGTLFGVTPRDNRGPLPDTALVSINLSTAEVTLICELPRDRQPNIGLNPENNSLYYFTNGDLNGKITDTSGDDCKVKAPGGGGNNLLGFIFDYVSYTIISMILPPAEAGNGEGCEQTKGVTWWGAESTFLAGGFCLQTIDPDTGDDGVVTNDLGHSTKGLAFAFVGRSGGGGGGHGYPTIGVNDEGILVVTCGVNFDGRCFTITAPFHEEFKLYEMMSGTHTISITMLCANGVTTCNYAAIAIMPYSESMDNTTWKIEVYKDNEGNLTTVKTDPEGYLGTITVTTQILDDKFWIVSFTVDFKNKDTGPMMFGVQVRDNYNAARNWYLNEGVEFKDSDAYPTIETEFDESLEIDSLCLNEDPTYRYSCAFAEIRDRAIQLAEETLRQMLNGGYTYK